MKCRDCSNLHLIRECKNLLWCDDVLDAPDPDAERECKYFKRATNYDRLVSKTPEELARWIAENTGCSDWCHLSEQCAKNHDIDDTHCCITEWYNWLKAPVEEVDDGT